MDVIVYGAGNLGTYIVNEIQNNPESGVYVKYVIDNEKCEGITNNIISFGEYLKRADDNTIIVAIRNPIAAQNVVLDLLENGIEEILLPFSQMFEGKLDVISRSGGLSPFFLKWRDLKLVLPYLEYQVADECNLRCKGCMHFSNLVSEPKHASVEEYEKSIVSLSKSFFNIERIRLMGGEPLLNPDLDRFIRISRDVFPLADIRVVTNGIIITKMPTELIDAMRECGVRFDITQYSPIQNQIKEIIEFLDACHIGYYLGEKINRFIARMSYGEENPHEIFYNSCLSNTCTFLRNERLYVCPQIPMLYEQKGFFGFEIKQEEFIENGIDIECTDGWRVLKQLRQPRSMCRFCSPSPKSIEWEVGRAKRRDWIV